jgi:hypothetical protein
MLQKLKMLILSLSSLFVLAAPLVATATVSAAAECKASTPGTTNCIQGGLCKGAEDLTIEKGTGQCNETGTGLSGTIATVINVLSVVVGIVAVVMIIVGGLRYITSGGSSEKVTGAKNTILYAIIGLVIVALAQVIVRFVLNKTANAG